MVTSLVRPDAPDDSLEALAARLSELDATLAERTAEVIQVRSTLTSFRITYRQQVGALNEQLEQLELEIAEAELGELSKRVSGDGGQSETSVDARPAPLPRFTSDAVRKLFRDVAKTIHPDLAWDEITRDRRHALMIDANRAYALGDEEQLRWVLQAWERSPEAVRGSDPEAMRLRLTRRIAEIEEQLALLATDLAAMTDSPTWKLKRMVDEAAARGNDLVRETVTRLRRDIMAATNRLEAMRYNPKGRA